MNKLESCCGCAFTEHVAHPGNTNNCESRSGTWHICCPLIVDSTLHQVTGLGLPRQNAGMAEWASCKTSFGNMLVLYLSKHLNLAH